MRDVVINKAILNIPTAATCKLYVCDRYGNQQGEEITLLEETQTVALNSNTLSFKTPTGYIVASYSLYRLSIIENKNTRYIPLFIFDGEGALATQDIISPFAFQSIFSQLFYIGEKLPTVLEDFITKLDQWFFNTQKELSNSNYKEPIAYFLKYAEYATQNKTYMNAPCLLDMDAVLAKL